MAAAKKTPTEKKAPAKRASRNKKESEDAQAASPAEATPQIDGAGDIAPDILESIAQWYELRQQIEAIAPIVEEERTLRKAIDAALQPTPREGTSRFGMPNGYTLAITTQFKRKLDDAVFPAIFERIPGELATQLIRWKPELKTAFYRTLDDDKRVIFDECVSTEPQSPQFAILPPKEED